MNQRTPSWYLEGLAGGGTGVFRTAIAPLPFTIGRRPGSHLQLRGTLVSGNHAVIDRDDDDGLVVRDLASTNGTYVEGARISAPVPLEVGSTLRFADQEYRVVQHDSSTGFRTTGKMGSMIPEPALLNHIAEARVLLDAGSVEVHLQPVVDLSTDGVAGYEVLGRGALAGEPAGPLELFRLAEVLGRASELADLFRHRGLTEIDRFPEPFAAFVNIHPSELRRQPQLLACLNAMRRAHPRRPIVLEIHEAAVTELSPLRSLASELETLDIEIAYDDFGTGQDRLMALAETDPGYLKFDISFVRGIDIASERRRELVARLVELVRGLGIAPLAEGVETAGEHRACVEIGFAFAQGYHLGRPAPAASIVREP